MTCARLPGARFGARGIRLCSSAHGKKLLVIAGGTVTMPLVNDGISLPERVMGPCATRGIDRLDGG